MIFLIIRTVAVEIIDRLYVVHRPMGILLPVVFSYGGVELLRVGETFHSRTKKAYAFAQTIQKMEIVRAENNFGKKVKGLSLYGGRIIRPAEIVVAKFTPGTETAI